MFYKHSDYEGKRRNHQFLPINFAHTLQPRRHCKHKRDKNPDNPAWSLGCCSLTREVLSSIAEYRSPDLSPGKQRSRRGELTTERWLVKWTITTGVRVNFRCVARLQV